MFQSHATGSSGVDEGLENGVSLVVGGSLVVASLTVPAGSETSGAASGPSRIGEDMDFQALAACS